MSLFQSPDELADELARARRKLTGVSPETLARLETEHAREVRWLRIARQVMFLLYGLPLLLLLVIWGVLFFLVDAPTTPRWP